MLPWAWKGAHGKPVFNFRSDGRSFAKSRRVLIPADGFDEGVDMDSLLPLLEIVLLVVSATLLRRLRRAAGSGRHVDDEGTQRSA